MQNNRWLVLGLCATVIAGCTSIDKTLKHPPRQKEQRVVFNSGELPSESHQQFKVTGQVILDIYRKKMLVGGEGLAVVLNPVSPLSNQWYQSVCKEGKILEGRIPKAYEQRVYRSYTDNQGSFEFEQVPAGYYYLSSQLYWFNMAPYSGPVQRGGLMSKRVYIGADANINLTNQDACPGYFN